MVFSDKCLAFLNSVYDLGGSCESQFKEKLHFTMAKKNDILLEVGELCDKLWFLNKGLTRGFYLHGNKEITSWFAVENQFFYAADSFLNEKPTSERIQVIEPVEMVYIYKRDLYELYDEHPSLNHAARIFAERYRLLNHERLINIRMHTAKERLELFAKNHRSLFLRVPQKHIASHIGISEGYVSELLGRFKV
ncbi:Crp/Fnr family transcriptional regulator [Dyadobacter sp. CY312]|uniref:Crp/Fnr family transcriptional regulator n=1 Tax=Dyadobacter sp. CY312 TaxID=2907303 RepID=UPI001F3689D4|nr:Crp/Fnr family transcriptional regulator [Dyadobacter sp. CY312]MCE7043826.1 Crp/Fnr family transcriptional regulator [Dyadobacter sp. CY312]